MEFPTCFRCQGTHVVPGSFGEPAGVEKFVVDAGIAKRAALFAVNHEVKLEELAWLCLDCGIAWQPTESGSLEELITALREKCRAEFAARVPSQANPSHQATRNEDST